MKSGNTILIDDSLLPDLIARLNVMLGSAKSPQEIREINKRLKILHRLK